LNAALQDFARRLGCEPFALPPGARAAYHASAHYAGAFVPALMREASLIWQRMGLTEAQALAALLPLLRGTLASIAKDGPARGLAGTVSRGDMGTLKRHLQALDAHHAPQAGLYRELSRHLVPLALEKGSIGPEQARALRDILNAAGPGEETPGASGDL